MKLKKNQRQLEFKKQTQDIINKIIKSRKDDNATKIYVKILKDFKTDSCYYQKRLRMLDDILYQRCLDDKREDLDDFKLGFYLYLYSIGENLALIHIATNIFQYLYRNEMIPILNTILSDYEIMKENYEEGVYINLIHEYVEQSLNEFVTRKQKGDLISILKTNINDFYLFEARKWFDKVEYMLELFAPAQYLYDRFSFLKPLGQFTRNELNIYLFIKRLFDIDKNGKIKIEKRFLDITKTYNYEIGYPRIFEEMINNYKNFENAKYHKLYDDLYEIYKNTDNIKLKKKIAYDFLYFDYEFSKQFFHKMYYVCDHPIFWLSICEKLKEEKLLHVFIYPILLNLTILKNHRRCEVNHIYHKFIHCVYNEAYKPLESENEKNNYEKYGFSFNEDKMNYTALKMNIMRFNIELGFYDISIGFCEDMQRKGILGLNSCIEILKLVEHKKNLKQVL